MGKPVKAYKAFDGDLRCRGYQFEVGKTYLHRGPIGLCSQGFHACRSVTAVFDYYDFCGLETGQTRVCEVELRGRVEHGDDKSVCSKIVIVRELSPAEVLEVSNTGSGNTGYGNTGDRNSGDRNTGSGNTGDWNSGDRNTGSGNSGSGNTGNWNSGDRNSGDGNTGSGNRGDRNTGSGNSGNWNSGSGNTGDWNSGDGNTGSGNRGDRNTGSGNSGNWNSGDGNSGHFNVDRPGHVRVFGKMVSAEEWANAIKPDLLYFLVRSGETYKQAFARSWNEAPVDDRRLVTRLPGFDWDIFTEISGIEKPEDWD